MILRQPEVVSVDPEPDAAIVEAIDRAVKELWPKPQPAVSDADRAQSWRFSGRWWAQPAALRRDRPLSTI